jgi:LPXTG-motif cell wall-anchored protein
VSPSAAGPPDVPDWIWQGSAPTLTDGVKDDTAYGQGSSEDTDPSGWSKASADSPKTDLVKYYFNVDTTGDVIVSFGFTRAAATGDTAFAVEMNKLANSSDSPPRPNRSVGDLLLKFDVDSGSSPLLFAHGFLWKAKGSFAQHAIDFPGYTCQERYSSGFGWCEIPRSGFQGRTPDDFTAEGKVNLTTLFGEVGCSGAFRSVNLRSESSSENWTNSLQDYLPLTGATVPNTCASLVIDKYRLQEAGHTYTSADLLTGAHFDVYAGSTATGTPVVSDVYDGKAGVDADTVSGQITIDNLEPGTYTVKETSGPSGYFPPSGSICASQDIVGLCTIRTKTLIAHGTGTVGFYNQKIWQPLNVTKDGSGAYKARYFWTIQKGVADSTTATAFGDTDTKNVPDDGDGTTSAGFGYRVTVTQDHRETTDIAVTGKLYVDNPNPEPVDITLSDNLDGATCGFDDATVRVPADAVDQPYDYTCTYPDGTDPSAFDTTNVGHIAWSAATYPQDDGTGHPLAGDGDGNYSDGTGNTTIGYTETATDKTVTVHDDKHAFVAGDVSAGSIVGGDWQLTWAAGGGPYTATYARSISAAAGTCNSDTNTATLSSDPAHPADATATVCVGENLDVSKVSKESLTRTYLWTISKTNTDDGPLFVDPSTGHAMTHWDITVAANGKQDTALQMTGTITVTNPNDWEDVQLTGLTDRYGWTGGGKDCSIDGWATMTAADKTIPQAAGGKDGTKDFDYTCVLANGTPLDGTNRATITWDAAAAHTPASPAESAGTDFFDLAIHASDWTLDQENNKTVTVNDGIVGGDPAVQIAGPFTWTPTFTTTFEYTVDLGAPPGACQTWTNSATLRSGGSQLGDPAEDDVTVCSPSPALIAKDTPTGTFDRTYRWDLAKFVKNAAGNWVDFASYPSTDYKHTFDYQVRAIPLPVDPATDDSNWLMSGMITLTNQNTDSAIPDISGDIVEVPSVGAVSSTCRGTTIAPELRVGVPFVGISSPLPYAVTMKSGDDPLHLWYECTFSGKPSYTASNVVEFVDAGDNVIAQSDAKPFSFAIGANGEHDKTLPVFDDKVDLSPAADLGDATWFDTSANASGADDFIVFPYSKELEADHVTTRCTDRVNTAWIGGSATEQSAVEDSATAQICPDAPHWTASKVNTPGDGPVTPGSDVSYQLRAHKVSGVDPTNVVLYDDLSALVGHVALPTEAELQAGASAGTVDLTGTLITWTIPVLGATDETLDFTVHVNADAYGVDLPNLVTAPTSDNCVDEDITTAADECKTDNDTPHFTLEKSSSADHDPVLPPYLGADGTVLTYTLHVVNDSQAPINETTMPGANVTDDLSAVFDDAHYVADSLDGPGVAEISGDTLTWTLPEIAAGASVDLVFKVQVDDGEWDQTLTNVAHPGTGGDCVGAGTAAEGHELDNCTTVDKTPKYAQIIVHKVDAETTAGLGDAQFQLAFEGTVLATGTTGPDGSVTFATKLQPGTYQVTETKVPDGYLMPTGGATQDVTVDAADLDNGVVPVSVTFEDPPTGSLAIAKAHYERNAAGTAWVPGDGTVDFGDEIRYVMTVTATGPKVFHDVEVTDYVPGWNPADHTTAPAGTRAVLESASISCGGAFTCTTDPVVNGKITWHLTGTGQAAGDVTGDVVGTVEFVVRMPNIPAASQTPGTSYAAILWNQATLWWTAFGDDTPDTHSLLSNVVTDAASATLPPQVSPPEVKPPSALPNTGGPDRWILVAGLLLLLGGGTLVAGDRRRRRRS